MSEPIQLVAVGDQVRRPLLETLAADVSGALGLPCVAADRYLNPVNALDPVRRQYHSTKILRDMAALGNGSRVLGVTEYDLFVPILTYVFGEAQLPGRYAVVSLHRLHDEFYGLPPDEAVLRQRLLKEALHEIGHTFGLRHCADWRCAMASAHAVELLDVKEPQFCSSCRSFIR
ncbi:MAG: archaemetzincin family Zn-dependent metalloprotease [Bryobacteraceae bacterium]